MNEVVEENQVFFLDLDKTILDQKEKISFLNHQALKFLKSKNKIIVFSTGRFLTFRLKEIAKKNFADYLICNNGAIIYKVSGFEKIHEVKIDKKSFLNLKEILQKLKIKYIVQFYDNFKKNYFFYSKSKLIKFFFNLKHKQKKMFVLDLKNLSYVNKILCFTWKKNKILDFENEISRGIKKEFYFARNSCENFFEVSNLQANKGDAAKWLLEKMLINKNKAIHFGDGENDLPVKNKVGKIMAMKNAKKDLKKIANYIGAHFEKSGFAKIIFNGEFEKI